MELKSAIESRRSVKHFDPNHRMTNDEINNLLSMAILAPTAFNLQHWRFVTVIDDKLRQEIRKAAWDQAQVTDASLLVALCADVKTWEKDIRRYWKNADEKPQEMMLPMIDQFYRGREWMQRDEAIRSCGFAAQTIMLTARDMGYDSCPMSGFDFDKVGEIINLPDDHILTMMIAVGKATKPTWARPGQLTLDEVVVKDKF